MIELRPDTTLLDEVVGRGVDIHLEMMSESTALLIVTDGDEEERIQISAVILDDGFDDAPESRLSPVLRVRPEDRKR